MKLSFECKWMELKFIMLSEVIQAQKGKGHMFSVIYEGQTQKIKDKCIKCILCIHVYKNMTYGHMYILYIHVCIYAQTHIHTYIHL
jgi:hypothetical protein